MQLPPENVLIGCLNVFRDAAGTARKWGRDGEVKPEQLADLMQAIHDIPIYLSCWNPGFLEFILHALKEYDEKWQAVEREGLSYGFNHGLNRENDDSS